MKRKRLLPPPIGAKYINGGVIDCPNELFPPGTPMPPPVEFVDHRPDPNDPNAPGYTYDHVIDCPNELFPPGSPMPPYVEFVDPRPKPAPLAPPAETPTADPLPRVDPQ